MPYGAAPSCHLNPAGGQPAVSSQTSSFVGLKGITMTFSAVLFDCDGVLVDSEPITVRVLRWGQSANKSLWYWRARLQPEHPR